MTTYHPNPEINAEVEREAHEAEAFDIAAGLPPSPWKCPDCGACHDRGHFMSIGNHRCLRCGYSGSGGVYIDRAEFNEWRDEQRKKGPTNEH